MGIEDRYEEEAARILAARAPYAAGGILLVFAAAWLFEHLAHPGRDSMYAMLFALEAMVLGTAVGISRTSWLGARRRIDLVIGGAVILVMLCAAYHVLVDGEREVLALLIAFIAMGTTVFLPWGVRGQLIVASAALLAFGFATLAGVDANTPFGVDVIALTLVVGFTVIAARLAELSYRDLLRRDAELRHANAELESSSRLKSEFVSTMSHELRTPLNVIIGYLDLLDEGAFGGLSEEQLQPLRRARQSARQLFELISSTLDLGRIDAGLFSVEIRPVRVAELMAELAIEVRELPLKPELTITWDIVPGLEIETDRQMLKLILGNLIGNAIKFTERGSVTIGVARSEGGIEFCVEDTGPGIPPAAAEAIFEPFRQLATGARRDGVGLGLHIVRRLAQLLSGRVRMESVEGRGSTFRIWLPTSPATARVPAAHEPSPAVASAF